MITYTARWIFPVSQAPLERGTVTVDGGLIVAVDPHGTRMPDVDLGNAAVIPGLVNAHTHLDLSGARGLIPPTDPEHFTDWLMGVIEYRKSCTPEQIQTDIRSGLKECMRSGTALLGDITANGDSWTGITSTSIRSSIFWEFIGLKPERAKQSYLAWLKWTAAHGRTSLIRSSASPHSPYSANKSYVRSLSRHSEIAIHVAESPGEMQLINDRCGPFVTFLEFLSAYDPDSIFDSYESLIRRTAKTTALLIHCNYLPINTQLTETHSVIYCPRTHAAFKHPRHPFKEFQDRGVNVALGTDSLASNPDLDIFEEARFVYNNRKDVSAETVLKMVTINGAKALGWADECGSLEPGKSADFVVMPLPDRDANDAYELLFETEGERRTLFRGEWRDCL